MICKSCGGEKPLDVVHFVPRPKLRLGFEGRCRECRKIATRKHDQWPPPLAIRFWQNVSKNGPTPAHARELGQCWIWLASRFRDGYGCVKVGNESRRTHRVSFLLEHGRWPEPQCLHRCDNRLCVRPLHLFEGTPADNVHDCAAKGRARGGKHLGERTGTAKLKDWDIPVIRAASGTHVEVARVFGVSDETIRAVRLGKSWTHITGSIV